MPSTPLPDDCPDCGLAEEWRSVPEWEGYYEISTIGRVRSLGGVRNCGYGKTHAVAGRIVGARRVILCRPGRQRPVMRFVLFAEVFAPEVPTGATLDWIDGNRSHVCVTNLGWAYTFVGYRGMHRRVERTRGNAKTQACVDCGGPAKEWSYLKTGVQEVAGTWGGYDVTYSLDPMQYVARCHKCHRAVDGWWLKYPAKAVA